MKSVIDELIASDDYIRFDYLCYLLIAMTDYSVIIIIKYWLDYTVIMILYSLIGLHLAIFTVIA